MKKTLGLLTLLAACGEPSINAKDTDLSPVEDPDFLNEDTDLPVDSNQHTDTGANIEPTPELLPIQAYAKDLTDLCLGQTIANDALPRPRQAEWEPALEESRAAMRDEWVFQANNDPAVPDLSNYEDLSTLNGVDLVVMSTRLTRTGRNRSIVITAKPEGESVEDFLERNNNWNGEYAKLGKPAFSCHSSQALHSFVLPDGEHLSEQIALRHYPPADPSLSEAWTVGPIDFGDNHPANVPLDGLDFTSTGEAVAAVSAEFERQANYIWDELPDQDGAIECGDIPFDETSARYNSGRWCVISATP